MTRFIFLADTHLGATTDAYHQQSPYPERLPELADCLRDWIDANAPIDFVLHGGDMIHEATRENIAAARGLFRMPVPVRLCLGNHDLTSEDALQMWLDDAPNFFPGGRPEFCIDADECSIYVMPNHWGARPYLWDEEQTPQFRPEQVLAYDAAVTDRRGGVDFFCTHSSVMGVPVEQTGFDEPFHERPKRFVNETLAIVKRSRRTRCILGAHTHMNSYVEKDGLHFVSIGAFIETPFDLKLFEVSDANIRMTTHNLMDRVTFDAEYDNSRAYAIGRPVDRAFEMAR